MIFEHVLISVASERALAYESAFTEARTIILRQPGCQGCNLYPKLDQPGEYLLLIEWNRKEDHTEGFRKSDDYRRWSALLHPFYEVFPTVDYYNFS